MPRINIGMSRQIMKNQKKVILWRNVQNVPVRGNFHAIGYSNKVFTHISKKLHVYHLEGFALAKRKRKETFK